jgi:hypothetical protein
LNESEAASKHSPLCRVHETRNEESKQMTSYSNPRKAAKIPDWPSGSRRVEATFYIETDAKRGERAVRVTTGAPVKLTFARRMRIVDGDDGRTYIARDHGHGMASVFRGDMKYEHETAHDPNPRYAELMELFQ